MQIILLYVFTLEVMVSLMDMLEAVFFSTYLPYVVITLGLNSSLPFYLDDVSNIWVIVL